MKETSVKDRVFLWDNLKFYSIICILVLHSTMPYGHRMLLFKYIGQFINLYPMTLFAIISGFWFKERSTKKIALIFLWPCILFSIVNGFLGMTSPHFPDYFEIFKFKPGFAMWYLFALFIFSLLTKHLKKSMGSSGCLIVAIVIAVGVGFLPISDRYLSIQRVSCLFPSFAFGVWFRDKICKGTNMLPKYQEIRLWGKVAVSFKSICIALLILSILFNLAIIYYFPKTWKYVGFTRYYGLNIKAAGVKWLLYMIRIVACTCMVFLVPNKQYWYTKYGSRTMNAYLLHMTIIFPLCWGLLYNYRNEWYVELACFVLVPLICTLFLSTPVDKVMRKILLLDYTKKIE